MGPESKAIGADTVVVRTDEPVAVEVDRSVVMMSLAQGMYYGLEGAGQRIWTLLDRPKSVAMLCGELMAEFEIDSAECQREVSAFLAELLDADLIRIHDAGSPDSTRAA
jgi:hypothetical protein